MNAENTRQTHLDILRIAALFAVVISHVSAHNWYSADINSRSWEILNAYDGLTRWGVPVFLMISGALFLNTDKPVRIIYTKYISRIAAAFIFWSVIYACVSLCYGADRSGFFASCIRGHYHMWYMFLIAGMYMIVPFLRKIIRDSGLCLYFLIISLLFAVIIPYSINIIGIFSERAGVFAAEIVSKFNMFFVCGLTIYYVLGYAINNYPVKTSLYRIIFLTGIAGFIITVCLSSFHSHQTGTAQELFLNGLTLNVFLESVLVFTLFKKAFRQYKFSDKFKRSASVISKYTFGAYLVHPLIFEFMYNVLKIDCLSFDPLISVPLISIIVFVLALIISSLLNHIPLLNRYIV